MVINLEHVRAPTSTFNLSVLNVRSPVEAPVIPPEPKTNLSSLSSQNRPTLVSEPRSITIPASPEAVPVTPFPSSNNLSAMVVLVVETVVVVPLTARLPVTVRSWAIVTLLGRPIVSV